MPSQGTGLLFSAVEDAIYYYFIITMIVSVCVLVAQSCLTLCDPMDYRLLGSSVHGIIKGRILEWVAISSSRGSSQPKD